MKAKKIAVLLAAAGLSASAFATNGYFAHGVGIKAKAMGGAGIAYAEDGFGIGANPATLSQANHGFALGATYFVPDRSASLLGGTNGFGGNIAGGIGPQDANHKKDFFIPEFAYVRHSDNGLSYGVAVYGNGGMNVDYGKAIYDTTGDKTFTNLEQLFIAPTIAKKLDDKHTIALSVNLVYQTFEAGGLDMFTCYTPGGNCGTGAGAADPGNKGKDTSTGVGIKLGWTGELTKDLSLGAFYQPKTHMSKFDKYKYLFAEHGKFDIPSSYGLGLAFKASPKATLLLDVVQIDYSKVKSLGNKNNHTSGTTNLGDDDGKGFGWTDMTVYKLGIRYELDDKNVLRAGWNHGKQPIRNTELDFNLLAPAVIENHLTLGLTRKLGSNSELSFHYMHAFNKKITGTMANGTGTIHVNALEMSQNELGVQYSWRY